MADRKQNGKNNRRRNGSDDDFNPKFRKVRKKVCVMCSNKDFVLDYKNADQLKKFINEKGKYYQEEQQVLAQNIKEILHKL